jgi:selenocysteine lyase/cysteine desulfurase
MPDWSAIRKEYPALQGRTFLNTATFGQLSNRTTAAMLAHLDHRQQNACADFLSWFDDHDRLRSKLAQLIHAEPADIAFIPNAAAALGLLTAGIDWREGDEIAILDNEFPNQIYAPKNLTARGVTVRETPWPEFLDSINPRTRLVTVSSVNYSTGFRLPLLEIAARCRAAGALFYLDGTQSAGALDFDFSRVQPHLFSVNCYKWMLAPNGAAFMAVHPRLRDRLAPLSVGWRSHQGWRNVDNLHQGAPVFVSSAEKYEGGMLSSMVLYGLEASVDFLLETGMPAIEARALSLAAEVRNAAARLGGHALPHHDSAIAALRFDGVDSSALARSLKARDIQVSARYGLLRVSTHFYNDLSDVDTLESALRDELRH